MRNRIQLEWQATRRLPELAYFKLYFQYLFTVHTQYVLLHLIMKKNVTL